MRFVSSYRQLFFQATYGGVGSNGDGVFSGKDPSKMDRSAAYFARYTAKSIVAAELAPNSLFAVAGLATKVKDFGQEEEAVVLFEQAMRLSPIHPWHVPSGYGATLHLVGRKDDAVASFKRAIALKANHVYPHAFFNGGLCRSLSNRHSQSSCQRGLAAGSEISRNSIYVKPYAPRS